MEQLSTFTIDKITNSIEESGTGKVYETDVLRVSKEDIRNVFKKDGWLFNWRNEFKNTSRQVYKMVLRNDSAIQGLISLEPMDGYIELYLIENAPHNYGNNKKFIGVAGNMVAFACKASFELGFDGCIAFTAKTDLVRHYEQALGAQLIYSHNRMGIFPESAKKLVNSYFKEYFNECKK